MFNPAHLVESVSGILQLATRMFLRVCKLFSLTMNLRDLDIRGVRPFNVNSDLSSMGTESTRWLRSFQLYAESKGLIIVPDKDDSKVQRQALLLHCAGLDVQIFLMFWQTLGVRKIIRRLKMH